MESIIRNHNRQKITLADFYANIRKGKDCPEFYRDANLQVGGNECLILETLGKGGMGFVFLAYHQRKLTAIKMSYEPQTGDHIFSTVKKATGDDYRDYFLAPQGENAEINSFYLGKINEENKHFFHRDVTLTPWEPADAVLTEKLDESFENKLKWFRQFLKGLTIIHSRGRAHFDIKPDNLFLVGDRLKIGDFEFYYKIEDFKKSDLLVGTPGHIAPEMFLSREQITAKVDIFSAGIAFAQLFTGQSAAGIREEVTREHREDEMKELFLANHRIYEFFKDHVEKRLALPSLPGKERAVLRLLLRMIELSPNKRPAAEELLEEVNAITGSPRTNTAIAKRKRLTVIPPFVPVMIALLIIGILSVKRSSPPVPPLPMAQKIAEIHTQSTHEFSTQSYLDTFRAYIGNLKEKSPDEILLPYRSLKDGQTVHAVFIKKAFAVLKDDSVSPAEKQEIAAALLDYLLVVIQRKWIDKVKNDPAYPVKGRFLQELAERIETGFPGNAPSIRSKLRNLYCALEQETNINPYALKKLLGKEVEPCPRK